MGFSRDVTRIISLKILLNAGASLFASSTSGLQGHLKLDNIISCCRDLPDFIPELGKLSLITNIDFIPSSWLYEDPDLVALTAKHHSAVHITAGTDEFLHGSGDCLFPRREYQNIIDPPDATCTT
jgi:hypothetical protein